MANKALAKILDVRDARQRSEIQAQILRSQGWPTMNSGIATPYGAWTSGSPTGLARPPETFTQGGFAPVTPIIPATIDTPQDGLPRPSPRRWEYPVAWNMPVLPGSEGVRLTSFAMMRQYADRSTILRSCINKRKDEIVGLPWDIVPTVDKQKELTDKASRQDFNDRRQIAMGFFSKPDPDYNSFHSWLKAILEDIFVIDALSIYLAPRRDGDPRGGLFGSPLAGLMLIDGSTIRPMLALDGGRPEPPSVAYQQYIWGVPRIDLMDALTQDEYDQEFDPAAKVADLMGDQLLYIPYNKRTSSPYGLSHVESCLVPTGIDINKQKYVLGYYTEGNTPSSWVTVGNVDTPQQVRQWQDTLDAMIGDIGARHQVFVLPHGSSAVETKPNLLRDDYDSTNREVMFSIFGLTAMEMGFLPGGKSGGLTGGSGMSAQHATDKIRTASIPLLTFLKREVMDFVLQQICGQHDMQFQWPDLLAIDDAAQQMAEDVQFVDHGIITRDEVRRTRGLLPFDLPLTNEPTVTTSTTGVTSLVGNPSGSTSQDTSPLQDEKDQHDIAMQQAKKPPVAPTAPTVTPTTQTASKSFGDPGNTQIRAEGGRFGPSEDNYLQTHLGVKPDPNASRVTGGVLHTTDMNQAIAWLSRAPGEVMSEDSGHRVDFTQPRMVSTLLSTLADKAQEAQAKGEAAPTINLEDISVKGTNIFAHPDDINMPRIAMPQFTANVADTTPGSVAAGMTPDKNGQVDIGPGFEKYLTDNGFTVTHTTEDASYLHATQNEINGAKVGALMTKWDASRARGEIFVSKDNYILDGHNAWAAQVGLEYRDNTQIRMGVARASAPISVLLPLAISYASANGIPPRGGAEASTKAMRTELQKLQNYVRHGRDISRFKSAILPSPLLDFVRDNLFRGAATTFKYAHNEVTCASDPLYVKAANTVTSTIRDVRSGAIGKTAGVHLIEKVLRRNVDDTHDLHSMASRIVDSETPFEVIEILHLWHDIVSPKNLTLEPLTPEILVKEDTIASAPQIEAQWSPNITIHMPPTPAPVMPVTINVPEQKAMRPSFVFNVPSQEPPKVKVSIPPQGNRTKKFIFDDTGLIIGSKETID